jgi:Tfp pilus assembly PilM family ATPase
MKAETAGICGLDLQKNYFSIVQYAASERAVTLLSIQPFPESGDVDRWKIWKKQIQRSRGRLRFFSPSVVCGMPAEYAVVKLIPVDEGEIRVEETIEWELGQHLGRPLDEFVYDVQEEEANAVTGAGARKVLAVAYRQELIHRMTGIVRGVRMRPVVVDLDIFGLVNAFSANYPERTAAMSLIVHSEFENTKLVLTRNGRFSNYHCFEHASGSVDPAGFAALLSAEIGRFLTAAKESSSKPALYITGSYFQQDISREAFLEKVSGAEILDPFRSIKCQVKIDEQQFQSYSTQLAVAVGLALRGGAGGEA